MKKLMMAVAIVCAAVGAQASTVNWGGAFATVDNQYLGDGSSAYLVFSTTAFTSPESLTLDKLGVDGKLSNGGAIVAAHTFNATELEAASFASDYNGAYNEISGYYGILVKDVANDKLAWKDMGSASFASEMAEAANLFYNLNWSESDTQWLGDAGYNVTVGSTPGPVPEPTSGLLLLLGVAGMALRRRRA